MSPHMALTCRSLPIALAHVLANTKLGEADRLVLLNRIFARLNLRQQFECKAELLECKAARRGLREAAVS